MSYSKQTVSDKYSLYLLQCVDCNCNDCRWMVRDLDKYRAAQELRKGIMTDHFHTLNQKEKETALEKVKAGKTDIDTFNRTIREIDSRQYVHSTPNPQINYGRCTHPDYGPKDVNFLPTTFSGDTRHCFEHRNKDKFEQG